MIHVEMWSVVRQKETVRASRKVCSGMKDSVTKSCKFISRVKHHKQRINVCKYLNLFGIFGMLGTIGMTEDNTGGDRFRGTDQMKQAKKNIFDIPPLRATVKEFNVFRNISEYLTIFENSPHNQLAQGSILRAATKCVSVQRTCSVVV